MADNVYTVVTGNFCVWLHTQIIIDITTIITNSFSFVNYCQKDFQAMI